MCKVIVLGSINIDMVMETDRFPEMGETILGETVHDYLGGKGANQAVAAARMGVETTLVARVGSDPFASKAIAQLEDESIHTAYISVEADIRTGLAAIFSIKSDNAIVVLPGANMSLKNVRFLADVIQQEDVLLTQLEIPMETVGMGLKIAKAHKALTILNPAPFDPKVMDVLEDVDIITPNETEFESMVGHSISQDNLEQEMLTWQEKTSTQLIVTRGSKGVSFIENNKVVTMPAQQVDVVDTTGAGDTFNGILAAALSNKLSVYASIQKATIGASLSTTKKGAQKGMPTKEQMYW